MENQSKPLMKLALAYGLYLGLAFVLNAVIFYVIGKPFASASAYVTWAIIIGWEAYFMYSFWNSAGGEGFTYGRAVGIGTLQWLFASIILAFFGFILNEFIDPNLIEKSMVFTKEKLLSEGLSEDQVDSAIIMSKKMMTPTFMFIQNVGFITLMGSILTLIITRVFGIWKVYEKAGKPGWASLIPIYNQLVFLNIIGKPGWWILCFFLPGINLIFLIWANNLLSKSFGKDEWFTVGLSILGIVFVPILGYSEAKYLGPAGRNNEE